MRIQPELNLEYPDADIVEITKEGGGSYQITTSFFGLYGVSSPLPGFYTEELLDDEWDELNARKSFLDVIHNHTYPLLYQAWLKYKFAHNIVEFEDSKYAEIIFNLIGLSEVYRKQPQDYGYLLKYSGILSQRSKNLAGLKTILQDFLGDIALDVKPCIRRKVAIVKSQRCMIGYQNTTLGADVFIGKEVIDRSGKFLIELGPLDENQFGELTSQSNLINSIKTILNLYLVQPLEFTITLLLKPGVEKPIQLSSHEGSTLGSNCWLIHSPNQSIERVELHASSL
ncbi:MAG: type VI secretion system protein ImpH [Gammaproteobacteria bacterium]